MKSITLLAVILLYNISASAQKRGDIRIYKDSITGHTMMQGESISIMGACKALTTHFKHALVITNDDPELHEGSWVITSHLGNSLPPAMKAIELTNKIVFSIKNDTLYLGYRAYK